MEGVNCVLEWREEIVCWNGRRELWVGMEGGNCVLEWREEIMCDGID
jgi:hypothetical protein